MVMPWYQGPTLKEALRSRGCDIAITAAGAVHGVLNTGSQALAQSG